MQTNTPNTEPKTVQSPAVSPTKLGASACPPLQRKLHCITLAGGGVEEAKKIYDWLYSDERVITSGDVSTILKNIAETIRSYASCEPPPISQRSTANIIRRANNEVRAVMKKLGMPDECMEGFE